MTKAMMPQTARNSLLRPRKDLKSMSAASIHEVASDPRWPFKQQRRSSDSGDLASKEHENARPRASGRIIEID